MTVKAMFELAALAAAALGVPIAVYQLYVGRREAQAGRDLQVALALSESFREKWDAQWAAALRKADHDATLSQADELALESMLNWVDWLGTLMKHGHLADSGVVLDTLTFPINELLGKYRKRILSDVDRNGRDYWGGVLEVASKTCPGFDEPEDLGV